MGFGRILQGKVSPCPFHEIFEKDWRSIADDQSDYAVDNLGWDRRNVWVCFNERTY